jgi:hypothetical protein
VADAAEQTNINRLQIIYSTLCKDSHATVGGYIWLFIDDIDKLSERAQLAKKHKARYGYNVAQYTLDGKKIKTYASLHEVEREHNYDHSAICGCCKGKYKQAYGYIWRYADDNRR